MESMAFCHELLSDAGVPLQGPFAPLSLADRITYLVTTVNALRDGNRRLHANLDRTEKVMGDVLRGEYDTASTKRCPKCHWPLAATPEEGCVPGNCSERGR